MHLPNHSVYKGLSLWGSVSSGLGDTQRTQQSPAPDAQSDLQPVLALFLRRPVPSALDSLLGHALWWKAAPWKRSVAWLTLVVVEEKALGVFLRM